LWLFLLSKSFFANQVIAMSRGKLALTDYGIGKGASLALTEKLILKDIL